MIKIRILGKKKLMTEANVTTMSQMYKVPVGFAEIMNDPENWLSTNNKKEIDACRRAVDVFILLSKIIYGAINAGIKGDSFTGAAKADMRSVDRMDLADATSHEAYADYYGHVAEVITHMPNSRSEFLKAMSINDIKSIVEKYKPQITKKAMGRFKENVVLSFEDGSFWSRIPEEDWAMCGTEMQHCARPSYDDSNLYQLFDSNGKWNVTIEMRPNKEIVQIKGKQNRFPEEKYWEAIASFIDKFKAKNKEPMTPSNFIVPNYIVLELRDTVDKIYNRWVKHPELQQTLNKIKDQPEDDRRIGHDIYQELLRFSKSLEYVYEEMYASGPIDMDHEKATNYLRQMGYVITPIDHYNKVFFSIEKVS